VPPFRIDLHKAPEAAISIGPVCLRKGDHRCQYFCEYQRQKKNTSDRLLNCQLHHRKSKGSLQDIFSDVIGSLDTGGYSCLGTPDLCILIAALKAPGTDVMIFKIFSPQKFGENIGIFLLKLLLVFAKI
jgi:hypothetical protein